MIKSSNLLLRAKLLSMTLLFLLQENSVSTIARIKNFFIYLKLNTNCYWNDFGLKLLFLQIEQVFPTVCIKQRLMVRLVVNTPFLKLSIICDWSISFQTDMSICFLGAFFLFGILFETLAAQECEQYIFSKRFEYGMAAKQSKHCFGFRL